MIFVKVLECIIETALLNWKDSLITHVMALDNNLCLKLNCMSPDLFIAFHSLCLPEKHRTVNPYISTGKDSMDP